MDSNHRHYVPLLGWTSQGDPSRAKPRASIRYSAFKICIFSCQGQSYILAYILVGFTKLLLDLSRGVGPQAVVPLVGDRGQLLLGPPLLLLERDGAVVVGPVLEDVVVPLQLPDLVQERISPPGQHEVEV